MALGTREMLLVIRARDEASRVLGRLASNMRSLDSGAVQAARDSMARGGALVSLGAGITAMGAAGLNYLNDTTDAAAEYEQAARKALTQTDGVKVSLEQLKRLGRDVGRDIPASFDQMQESLYTIFSTIDTDMPGAEKLLRAFSKAAVAGQTDINTATEGGLQALNSFGLGVEGVTRVNDVMFRLVQKGVGTYEQFVSSLGKAGPSAKRAGQDIETLAGMMAFLTRNGLSTSMASTSAARALDLISNSKVDKRLQDMGIAVRDANGEFRPMSDIITDLGKHFADFTAPERAAALENLFKGSGNNVQARRFFDLAIPGFQQLNSLTGSMRNSAGSMDKAYQIMFDSPQSKVQLLTNRYEAMKTEIGDQLIPIKLKLLEILSKLLDWWEKLPGSVQKGIVIFAAVAAVLMTLIGIVTVVAGAMLVLSAAVTTFDIAMLPLLATIGLVVAALAAIGVVVYLVIKYWDNIKSATLSVWDAIWNFIGPTVKKIAALILGVMSNIGDGIAKGADFIVEAWWTLVQLWNDVSAAISGNKTIMSVFGDIVDIIKIGGGFIQSVLVGLYQAFSGVFQGIGTILAGFFAAVGSIINGIVDIFSGIIRFVVGVFTGNWSMAWKGIAQVFQGVVSIIGGIAAFLGSIFAGLWQALVGIFNGIKSVFTGFWSAVSGIAGKFAGWVSEIVGWINSLPGKIGSIFASAGKWLLNVGSDLLSGLWNGIKSAGSWLLQKVGDFFGNLLPGWVRSMLGIKSPSTVFAELGRYTMQGFAKGMDTGAISAVKSAVSAAQAVNDAFNSTVGLNDPQFSSYASGYVNTGSGSAATTGSAAMGTTGTNSGRPPVKIDIHTQEINPLQHATELGMLIAETV